MKVEYNGYTLEIEEVEDNEVDIKYYTANCAELPYFPSGIFKTNLVFIIEDFKRMVHAYTFNQLNKNKEEEEQMKTFNVEYKGYVLEVEINKEYSYIKGVCESISFENSGHISVTISPITALFIEKVDLLTESKKKDTSHTHLLTQLDRLAQKDKEDNFTPFELRGQLIEIYHLFGKILSLTLEDIYKLYFTRAET